MCCRLWFFGRMAAWSGFGRALVIWSIRARGNAQRHDLLGDPADRAFGDPVGRRDVRRHGPVRAAPRSRFCAGFCASRAAFPATTPSRACSACSTPTPSRPASAGSSRPSRGRPRPTGRGRPTGRRPVSGGVVAVDGKTARRSFDRKGGRRPLHMVNAWAVEQGLVLGQRKVDGDSNEIGGPARAAGAARPRPADRHRGRDALPESDRPEPSWSAAATTVWR